MSAADDVKLDFARADRLGFGEAILCAGKSLAQIEEILAQALNRVLDKAGVEAEAVDAWDLGLRTDSRFTCATPDPASPRARSARSSRPSTSCRAPHVRASGSGSRSSRGSQACWATRSSTGSSSFLATFKRTRAASISCVAASISGRFSSAFTSAACTSTGW